MSEVESMERGRIRELVDSFITSLKYEYDLHDEEIIMLLVEIEDKLLTEEVTMPISIYDNNELSVLESNCKYLKEELNLSYHQIALLLNRNDRTVWTTYKNATVKKRDHVKVDVTKIFVPTSIFQQRKLSVLESLVSYLKDELGLKYSEIGRFLNRDERNIWTVYNRAKKKSL